MVIIPVIFIVAMLLMGRMRPLFGQLQDRLDNLNRIVREQITGVRVIRAFTREATEAERFERGNSQLRQTMIGVGRLMSLMMPLMMFIMNLSNISIMWFGGKRIDAGGMEIGSLQAFIQYLMMILMSLMMAAMMSVMIPRAMVSASASTRCATRPRRSPRRSIRTIRPIRRASWSSATSPSATRAPRNRCSTT